MTALGSAARNWTPSLGSATKNVLQPARASAGVAASTPIPYASPLTTAAVSAVDASRASAAQLSASASRSTVKRPPQSFSSRGSVPVDGMAGENTGILRRRGNDSQRGGD